MNILEAPLLLGVVLAVSGCNWTELVSVSSTGKQGNGDSTLAALSADGRYVVFESLASNLVDNDVGGYVDVFVHDTVDGTTTRVSVDSTGIAGNGNSSVLAAGMP